MNYTKGEWEVTHFDNETQIFCNGRCIARNLYDEEDEPTMVELQANANLAAASPVNYERLKATTTILENLIKDYPYIGIRDALRQTLIDNHKALAKAEGKETQ